MTRRRKRLQPPTPSPKAMSEVLASLIPAEGAQIRVRREKGETEDPSLIGGVRMTHGEERRLARAFLRKLSPKERLDLFERLLTDRLRQTYRVRKWQKDNPRKVKGYSTNYREKQRIEVIQKKRRDIEIREKEGKVRDLIRERRGEIRELATVSSLTKNDLAQIRREMTTMTKAGEDWPEGAEVLRGIMERRTTE